MSLSERVALAQRTAHPSQSDQDNSRPYSVLDLRREVQEKVSFEHLASMVSQNPQRARNELMLACKQVLSEPQWSQLSLSQREKLTAELVDIVFGFGPIDSLIGDETVTEIMVNGSKSVYYEKNGKLEKSPIIFESDEQVRVLIDRIIGPLGRRIDESSPLVNARLPQGHRVHAVIPPISPDGPVLTIRAFTRTVLTLDDLLDCGSIERDVKTLLERLVCERKNMVVSGGTGSGKTTMLNALSCLIDHGERIITIEDSAELQFKEHPHVVRLEARPRNAEGTGEISIRELVVNALRMRPDRIIVGECRAGEAIDMLQAMLTGHDGSLTTLHASNPLDVVDRMVTMVRYATDLPVDAIEAQIANAFDYVIQVARDRTGGRFVCEIAEVSFDRAKRRCCMERIYMRTRMEEPGQWKRELVA